VGPGTAHYDPIRDLMAMAERELSAFFRAVNELFGAEQAEASVEDWLRELSASEDIPASPRQWRTLTGAACQPGERFDSNKNVLISISYHSNISM